MLKKVSVVALGLLMAVPTFPQAANAWTSTLTTDQAVAKYTQYYSAYTQDELVKVAQYRADHQNIKGSLADQIVERAIWYMENGYMVYGHGYKAYQDVGIVDCSNFTSLVYGDFGFNLTTTSRLYDQVGTKVPGVYSQKIGNYWTLQGTENLRPGDILTWWAADATGAKHISHVAIYMGMMNGQPAVIGTRSDGNPTAIGIVNDFRWWWGSNFFSAQRVLPDEAWTPGNNLSGHQAQAPVIPQEPILPPQHTVVLPDEPNVPAEPVPAPTPAPAPNPEPTPAPTPEVTQYITPDHGWVGYFSAPNINSTRLGRLELGQQAPLVRKYNSYWYEILVNGQHVYITTSTNYTKVVSVSVPAPTPAPAPTPEPTPAPTPAPAPEVTQYITPDHGWVGYFSAPNINSTRLGRLELGQKAPLVKKYNSYWYEILVNGQHVYITTNTNYTKVVQE